ncbi:MAG TPA: adenylyl-sulfate kinase [Kofleriaceae bacterium]|nr:adenylyl-sulfate kinase [Kofleriaceae bacterium]
MATPPRNLTLQRSQVAARDRAQLLGQRGAVIWLTGLSGSGKSTIGYALEERLNGGRHVTYVLDGDNVRHGLCSDLGFSHEDRTENIRRIGEVASLFADAGLIIITSFISPYRSDRDLARQRVPGGKFIEVFLDVSVEVCERRDPKGLYKKARAGEILDFTGVSAPYERPDHPELALDTESLSLDACVDRIIHYLEERGFFDVSSAEAAV